LNKARLDIPVIALEETDSTNAHAIAAVREGRLGPPFWVTATRQTAGKGRDGRVWASVAGNLYASIAVPLDCDVRVAPQVALVAGVGVIDALRAFGIGQIVPRIDDLRLKWPNDILISNAKCGGILVQTTTDPATDRLVAVIGIGLNVVAHPTISGRETTDLAAEGFGVSADEVFSGIASGIDAALRVWDFGAGFSTIRARWMAAATRVGTAMSVHAGSAVAEGFFAGLDEDGALLMRDTGGQTQRYWFGDVVLGRA